MKLAELMPDTEPKIYPELHSVTMEIVRIAWKQILKRTKPIKSEMPYKQQYVLEELIRKLESMV